MESLVSFSREHDVMTKTKSEYISEVSHIVQLTTHSTLGVYDSHTPLVVLGDSIDTCDSIDGL